MYKVCDHNLVVLSQHAGLGLAKIDAEVRSRQHPDRIYFVCDCQGNIWASYGEDNGRINLQQT